ncbi:hypothetical protein, partial [Paraburkholderia fungorum]|uniref:hypothetical protein n=1 Tax=Paraburkholderia fungorum TaxID=134537 RepID=UPI001C851E66
IFTQQEVSTLMAAAAGLQPRDGLRPATVATMRQACETRYLAYRLVLAVEHPPHLANHRHRDHPQTPCLKN